MELTIGLKNLDPSRRIVLELEARTKTRFRIAELAFKISFLEEHEFFEADDTSNLTKTATDPYDFILLT